MSEHASNKRDNTHPSCTICQRRKVKCNRVYPCSACTRSKLECSFPALHRKRKRQTKREVDDSPAQQADRPKTALPVAPAQNRLSPPTLISDGAGSRYVKGYLYESLPVHKVHSEKSDTASTPSAKISVTASPPGEIKYGNVATGSRHLIFEAAGSPTSDSVDLAPDQIVALWQAYIDNVDPMMKTLHVPTIQHLVLGQIGKKALPVNDHCLVSTVYLVSAVSMTDEEWRRSFSEGRGDMLLRLRAVAERALSLAGFVTTTDFTVLQALLLYLGAILSLGESETFWAMMGMTLRIASKLGLTHDGSVLDIAPFDCEMRRRVWWTIIYLDSRTAETVGQDGDGMLMVFDVKPPSNVCDVDLFPSMQSFPEPRNGATETIYAQLRALNGICFRKMARRLGGRLAPWEAFHASNIPLAEKLDAVDEMEHVLESQVLQHCSRDVPLQRLTIICGRTVIAKVRLIVNSTKTKSSPETFFQEVFDYSMTVMENEVEVWSDPELEKWRWHLRGHFQWFPLACLMRQTRLHKSGPRICDAWAIIHRTFTIILPNLEVSPKQSVLLDGIKSLFVQSSLNCLKPQGEGCPGKQAINDASTARQQHLSESFNSADAPGSPEQLQQQQRRVPPHNALLPPVIADGKGTTVLWPQPVADFPQDQLLEIDFEAIDWDEFDRLATELWQQQ